MAMAGVVSGNLGSYIGATALKPFINSDLILGELIEFSIPGTQMRGSGMTTEHFELICRGYVQALHQGALTTDGHKSYLEAVEKTFGGTDIDFAQLVKIYGDVGGSKEERRYSPPACIGAKKTPIVGAPDPDHISTSYVERQNLTMRMSMKRFTRLSNAFSKKLESHRNALSLYFFFYNWCRIHKTLRVTPAMAAGLTDKLLSFEDLIALMDEAAPKPGRPKTYKKRLAV